MSSRLQDAFYRGKNGQEHKDVILSSKENEKETWPGATDWAKIQGNAQAWPDAC